MHAAMDKLGAGMPCGLVARFAGKTAAHVEAAVEAACHHFPVLQRHLVWRDSGPALISSDLPFPIRSSRSTLSLSFKTHFAEPWWRYRIVADGENVWLIGIWAHAAADGPSMLRFLQTIGAVIDGRSVPSFPGRTLRSVPRHSLALWLLRFAFEQRLLRYVRVREEDHPPGVTWLTVPFEQSILLCKQARSECGSFGAWLGAAACIAFREQQSAPSGRVLLHLPITRLHHERFAGFGFGSSSLIMAVKPKANEPLPFVACRIAIRQRQMIAKGWDANFERFLGTNPKRHLHFARLHARGLGAPMLTVSWKGDDWRLGGKDNIHDIACFANSTAVHISSHLDQNGLSVSVTSGQSATEREDLLRRIIVELGADVTERVMTFNGNSVETKLSSPAAAPKRSS
jgi:hypothetical protein